MNRTAPIRNRFVAARVADLSSSASNEKLHQAKNQNRCRNSAEKVHFCKHPLTFPSPGGEGQDEGGLHFAQPCICPCRPCAPTRRPCIDSSSPVRHSLGDGGSSCSITFGVIFESWRPCWIPFRVVWRAINRSISCGETGITRLKNDLPASVNSAITNEHLPIKNGELFQPLRPLRSSVNSGFQVFFALPPRAFRGSAGHCT